MNREKFSPESLNASSIEERLKEDEAIDLVLTNPEIQSYTTLTYRLDQDLPAGRELKPGRRLAFVLPPEFRHRIVRDVILAHRKGEKYRKDIKDQYDPHGAYSRLELHDTKTDKWLGWRDPEGYDSVKFAEPRPAGDPENEVLHDWIATVGEIKADAVRVTNVGKHPEYSTSQIHMVEVILFPELEGVSYQARIYCPGTEFIDLKKNMKLPKYGGGEHTEGKYKGAIALNQYREALYELGKDTGEGAEKQDDQLIIDLEPGKKLVQIEVAVGDTEFLKETGRGGGRRTRLGYSKLWVGVKRAATNKIEWFIKNANIPPQGVIAGGPHLEKGSVEPGDKLVIEARQDTAYIMGWRLGYKEME